MVITSDTKKSGHKRTQICLNYYYCLFFIRIIAVNTINSSNNFRDKKVDTYSTKAVFRFINRIMVVIIINVVISTRTSSRGNIM